jgi:hypothetical protein
VIRVEQGTEFVSRDLDLWAYQRGVTLDFSQPSERRSQVATIGRRIMQRTTLHVVGAVGIVCLAVLALAPARSFPLAGASAFTQATATNSPVILAKKAVVRKKLSPAARRQKLLAR